MTLARFEREPDKKVKYLIGSERARCAGYILYVSSDNVARPYDLHRRLISVTDYVHVKKQERERERDETSRSGVCVDREERWRRVCADRTVAITAGSRAMKN